MLLSEAKRMLNRAGYKLISEGLFTSVDTYRKIFDNAIKAATALESRYVKEEKFNHDDELQDTRHPLAQIIKVLKYVKNALTNKGDEKTEKFFYKDFLKLKKEKDSTANIVEIKGPLTDAYFDNNDEKIETGRTKFITYEKLFEKEVKPVLEHAGIEFKKLTKDSSYTVEYESIKDKWIKIECEGYDDAYKKALKVARESGHVRGERVNTYARTMMYQTVKYAWGLSDKLTDAVEDTVEDKKEKTEDEE